MNNQLTKDNKMEKRTAKIITKSGEKIYAVWNESFKMWRHDSSEYVKWITPSEIKMINTY